MPTTLCKQAGLPARSGRPARRAHGGWTWLAAAGCVAAAFTSTGCHAPTTARAIRLHDLEYAPSQAPGATRRCIVSDTEALRPLYRRLGERMGLIQIHSASEWERLAAAVPRVGPCPDFRRGMIVGLASPVGTSLDGEWPFRWRGVRLHNGAGLIEAEFNAGNYLPDGTTYLETTYVEGLDAILVVAVDGINYMPQ